MGFNIGGAITGALGGLLVGGPGGAIAGGVAGGFGGGGGGGDGGSSVEFARIPSTRQEKVARAKLFEAATGDLPEVPKREIAPLKPLGEERELARKTARELAEPQDFLSLPEVQAIIFEATEKGNLLANRLGRALQATGNITSTTGRDVVGRAVTDVQKSITASLTPFAVEERRRRERLIPTLEALGLTEEERRRGVTQAEKNALFEQQLRELSLETDFRPNLLRSIIDAQPAVQPILPTQGAGPLGGFESIIGPLLAATLTGKGGGSGFEIGPGSGSDII